LLNFFSSRSSFSNVDFHSFWNSKYNYHISLSISFHLLLEFYGL
jgi:hypothetical protein